MFRRFLDTETSGAKVLAVAIVAALVWANSAGDSYTALWEASLHGWLSFGDRISVSKDVVNDGLMAIFFLVVGLEIKRELVSGELQTWRNASLPVFAAVGGMLVPALIFIASNSGTATENGWAIPSATDIAFAVALLATFGSRIPKGLRVFVLSLAIVDDIGAIVIIAIFYGHAVEPIWLIALVSLAGMLAIVGRDRCVPGPALLVCGVAMWICAVFAGIHPAIAGVVLGLVISVRDEEGPSIESRLHPWTSLLVVPLFALANAGVVLTGESVNLAISSGLATGIVGGLVVGKVIGITSFSLLAVKAGAGALPEGVGWRGLIGAAAACGIGFTVSLFITDLAFTDGSLVAATKLSIFVGSALAAIVASFLLVRPGIH
jgi:NhaA family Na+:H+ antiporter